MEIETTTLADEVKDLKSCLNDLITVMALPALWQGGGARRIIGALLDVLMGMLRPELVYAEWKDPAGGGRVRLVRVAGSPGPSAPSELITQAIRSVLQGETIPVSQIMRNPFDGGELNCTVLSLRLKQEPGWLVVASRRIDFPSPTERLLIQVATNQAAIGLQGARRLRRQKRIAAELDQEVARRTSELTAANEGLRKEITERKKTEEMLRRTDAYLAEAERLSHTGTWAYDITLQKPKYWSAERCRISGFDPALGMPPLEMEIATHTPEDWAKLRETVQQAVRNKADFQTESRLVLPNGVTKHLRIVGHPVLNDAGDVVELVGSTMDVSAANLAETLLRGEKRLLEMIGEGAPLTAVLEELCRVFEELCEHSIASILLLDSRSTCLRHGAAPSLPPAYMAAIDGSAIGPAAGSCGTAAFRRQPVFVADIATDPLWIDYHTPALAHGLRACWSFPIFSRTQCVLGTFAVYYREIRNPDPRHREVMERIIHVAGIAIERYHTDETLRRSEVYLAEAQRISKTGSFGWIIQSGEIFWSAETVRVFGTDPTIPPTIDLVLERTHPEDRIIVREVIDRAVADGRDFDFQHRLRLPDGTVKHVRVVGQGIREGTDRVGQFVGAIQDITGPKRAEEALKLSEERFRQLADAIPEVIWITDLRPKKVVYCSPSFERIWGLRVEDLYREPYLWTETIHVDDRDRIIVLFKQWIAGNDVSYHDVEFRIVQPSGEIRWIHERGVLSLDETGKPYRASGISTDVTERRNSEEKLRISEAYLTEAQRISQTGSFSWNIESGEIIWSDETYRIWELDRGARPSFEFMRQCVHPNDVSRFDEALKECLHDGVDSDSEFRIVVPNGAIKHLHVVRRAVYETTGKVVQYVGAIRDISSRKLADEALQNAQAELAHVARIATVGELTASIAHELNQPLAGVVANAGTCLNWLGGDSPNLTEACKAAQRIIRDGKRAGEVITRLRALFKKTDTTKEPVVLAELIDEVVALLMNEIRRHGVTLRTEFMGEPRPVVADRIQLQQVVFNLVLNAAEALIGIDGRLREIFVATNYNEAGAVRVLVKDNGIGLSPQNKERIFSAFHTTKPGGMGMGLSISRSIVENHGGRIWVEANTGPGATFFFEIP